MDKFIHSITVYHLIGDNVTRLVFKKVYFRHNKKTNLIDKGLEKGSTGLIIIPTTNKLDIFTGDYIIKGIVSDEFNLKSLIKKYQVFKVVSVDDNRKGGLQHYKIGVSE